MVEFLAEVRMELEIEFTISHITGPRLVLDVCGIYSILAHD